MFNQMRHHALATAAGLAVVFAFAIPSNALAQSKKPTFEQAWAICKKELDAAGVPGANVSVAARHTAGGACMKRYGYRLKKKAKI
jgi:hypothetical protein